MGNTIESSRTTVPGQVPLREPGVDHVVPLDVNESSWDWAMTQWRAVKHKFSAKPQIHATLAPRPDSLQLNFDASQPIMPGQDIILSLPEQFPNLGRQFDDTSVPKFSITAEVRASDGTSVPVKVIGLGLAPKLRLRFPHGLDFDKTYQVSLELTAKRQKVTPEQQTEQHPLKARKLATATFRIKTASASTMQWGAGIYDVSPRIVSVLRQRIQEGKALKFFWVEEALAIRVLIEVNGKKVWSPGLTTELAELQSDLGLEVQYEIQGDHVIGMTLAAEVPVERLGLAQGLKRKFKRPGRTVPIEFRWVTMKHPQAAQLLDRAARDDTAMVGVFGHAKGGAGWKLSDRRLGVDWLRSLPADAQKMFILFNCDALRHYWAEGLRASPHEVMTTTDFSRTATPDLILSLSRLLLDGASWRELHEKAEQKTAATDGSGLIISTPYLRRGTVIDQDCDGIVDNADPHFDKDVCYDTETAQQNANFLWAVRKATYFMRWRTGKAIGSQNRAYRTSAELLNLNAGDIVDDPDADPVRLNRENWRIEVRRDLLDLPREVLAAVVYYYVHPEIIDTNKSFHPDFSWASHRFAEVRFKTKQNQAEQVLGGINILKMFRGLSQENFRQYCTITGLEYSEQMYKDLRFEYRGAQPASQEWQSKIAQWKDGLTSGRLRILADENVSQIIR